MEQEIAAYGVVGRSLTHSFSPTYFKQKFETEQIQHVSYNAFEVDEASDVAGLFTSNPNLKGLNVTIPFKTKVIPFLDELDEEAKAVGAVNTIKKLENGKLKGYNTDIYGFAMSIKPFFESHHERALIFGNGGAAKAIHHVLKKLGVSVMFVVRNLSQDTLPNNTVTYQDLGPEGIQNFKLLINTTPVGTYPNINECLPIPYDGITPQHLCYDLIYNPEKTLFLTNCESQGAKTINGLNMLKLQAEKSWEIWQ